MNKTDEQNQKIIKCPNCDMFIIIQELNCRIFRHGTYKSTGEQIPPHSPKEICDELVRTDQIYGCGKPFQIIVCEDGSLCPIKCDYI